MNVRMIPAMLTLVPIASVTLSSCSSTEPASPTESSSAMTYAEGVPGGTAVRTIEVSARVASIDRDNRKVTLTDADGKRSTVKVGPEAVNFDQVRVGDQVKATVTQEIVVNMAEGDAPPSEDAAAMVALAPKGGRPGGVMAGTVRVIATVVAIDDLLHEVTLQFPDGTRKTVAVRDDIDLSMHAVGERVAIQVTESVALRVEKDRE